MVAYGEFVFLGEHGVLSEIGWDGPQREKLWRYNQHYFDDLTALEAGARASWHRDLLENWVISNPPGVGNAWEPYAVSRRIVNWVKWRLAGNELPPGCTHSLAVQARWLIRRLEFHLLGNHLFANAKALVFAGLFFEGGEAERWLSRGLEILDDLLDEQVLPDGGHFERSTMYHALVLEDLLDLCNLAGTYPDGVPEEKLGQVRAWEMRVPAMCAWLKVMSHPDGEFALFNDAAFGVAPSTDELFRYVEALGLATGDGTSTGVMLLRESGYVRIAAGSMVALCDVAPVGPDYLPGHAHADTLSFELSAFGQRVLVNSGTSCYGCSAERVRQRGTKAHNTVVVDGFDSSEVWSGFRVARRARPHGLQVAAGNLVTVSCAHDGYARLPGRPEHRRRWCLSVDGLLVEDWVTGGFEHAEARFHLHPAVKAEPDADLVSGRMILPGGRVLRWLVEHGQICIVAASYHPRFGLSEPTFCLVVDLVRGRSRIRFKPEPELIDAHSVPDRQFPT